MKLRKIADFEKILPTSIEEASSVAIIPAGLPGAYSVRVTPLEEPLAMFIELDNIVPETYCGTLSVDSEVIDTAAVVVLEANGLGPVIVRVGSIDDPLPSTISVSIEVWKAEQ